MGRSSPVVRYLHFILLGRRVGLDGHWPSSFLYDHDYDAHTERARAVFEELSNLGYLNRTPLKIGPNALPGVRYEVTQHAKEYFISLDDPQYHQLSPYTTWAK